MRMSIGEVDVGAANQATEIHVIGPRQPFVQNCPEVDVVMHQKDATGRAHPSG